MCEWRRSGAALCPVDGDVVRADAHIYDRLEDLVEEPGVTQAVLDAYGLPAELLDTLHEAQQTLGVFPLGVARRGDDVATLLDVSDLRDLGGDLLLRQDPALAWLGTLTELDLDHSHLGQGGFLREGLLVEAAVGVPGAELGGAQLPDEVAAGLAVVGADAAFTGVVVVAAFLGAPVQREDGPLSEASEAHRRGVEQGGIVGVLAVRVVLSDVCASRLLVLQLRIGTVCHEDRAGRIQIELGAKWHGGVLVQRAGLDPLAHVARHGALLAVVGDEVLSQGRPD